MGSYFIKNIKYFSLYLVIFSLLFINTKSFAKELISRHPTNNDLHNFSKIFNSTTPLYEVDLISRSCSKWIKGTTLSRHGRLSSSSFYPSKNLLLQHENHLNSTTESINKGYNENRIQRECKPLNYPGDRMKLVFMLGTNIIGWTFEITASYCILPEYNFIKNGGCYYKHCHLKVPAHFETVFFSPYKKVAESMRKTLKPVIEYDSYDPLIKKSCMELR